MFPIVTRAVRTVRQDPEPPPLSANLRTCARRVRPSSLSFVFQKTAPSHSSLCGWFFPHQQPAFPTASVDEGTFYLELVKQ